MMSINLFVIGKASLSRHGGAAACPVGGVSCCCCGAACRRPVFHQSKKFQMLPTPGFINCLDNCRLHCAVCKLWYTYCSPSVVVPGIVSIFLNWIASGLSFRSFAIYCSRFCFKARIVRSVKRTGRQILALKF